MTFVSQNVFINLHSCTHVNCFTVLIGKIKISEKTKRDQEFYLASAIQISANSDIFMVLMNVSLSIIFFPLAYLYMVTPPRWI